MLHRREHFPRTIHALQVSGASGEQELACDLSQVVIAGWTGRDPVAREKHIRELEALEN